MIKELSNLTPEEGALVEQAPALITLLIGEADNHLDARELEQAHRVVHFRHLQGEPLLFSYYEEVEADFDAALTAIRNRYPGSPHDRAERIIEELSRMNVILPRLDRRFAGVLLESWRSLARSVAKASGGFLGYAQISLSESHYIGLEMITYEP